MADPKTGHPCCVIWSRETAAINRPSIFLEVLGVPLAALLTSAMLATVSLVHKASYLRVRDGEIFVKSTRGNRIDLATVLTAFTAATCLHII